MQGPWIKSYAAAEAHNKTVNLAERLGMPMMRCIRAQQLDGALPDEFLKTLAIGLLHRLWWCAARYGDDGFIRSTEEAFNVSMGFIQYGDWSAGRILCAADWLEAHTDDGGRIFGYTVHNWPLWQGALEEVKVNLLHTPEPADEDALEARRIADRERQRRLRDKK